MDEVLVAEIPRSGDRWAQANFDIETYENFFGAKVGSQRRVMLYHVDEAGDLAPVESRPSVEVASQNYRFELAAASGLPYPAKGRPIGVFARLSTGQFMYMLLFPGDPGHAEMEQLLATSWAGRQDRMRRLTFEASEVRDAWPECPLWTSEQPVL
jgi:hypothetical protein